MFRFILREPTATASKGQRPGRPELERLEDRLVPSLNLADGTILVPTFPSQNVSPFDTDPPYPTGLLGVDPNTGAQTEISVEGNFKIPSDVKQAPNSTFHFKGSQPLIGQPYIPPMFVADPCAGPQGQGAIIEVNSNTGAQTVVADSSDGYVYQPIVLAIQQGSPNYIYVGNSRLLNRVDFETMNPWLYTISNTSNATIENTTVLDGNWSMELNRNGTTGNVLIGQDAGTPYLNTATVTYSFLFRYHSQSGDADICHFQDTGGSDKGILKLNRYGYLVFVTADGHNSYPGPTYLRPDTTYPISLTVRTGTTNVPYQVLLNGNSEISGSGNLGANNNGSLLLGDPTGGQTATANYFYDDIATSLLPNQSLVMLDPTQLLQNGHYKQSFVTISGPGFQVPQGLFDDPVDSTTIAMSDEGGHLYDPMQGQIWTFKFTDPTHATQSAFGGPFPTGGPTDYRHPGQMTQDLMNLTTLAPIGEAGGLGGSPHSTGTVNQAGYTALWNSAGQGMTMGSGPYTYTIFLDNFHSGHVGQPDEVQATICYLDRTNLDPNQTPLVLTTAGYLSSPEGMSIYHTQGGSGYSPALAPGSPNKSPTQAQADPAGFTPAVPMPVSGLMATLPQAPPVMLGSDPIRLPPAEGIATGSFRPVLRRQQTLTKDVLDSFFSGWDNL